MKNRVYINELLETVKFKPENLFKSFLHVDNSEFGYLFVIHLIKFIFRINIHVIYEICLKRSFITQWLFLIGY
jgi:hypothetical protein